MVFYCNLPFVTIVNQAQKCLPHIHTLATSHTQHVKLNLCNPSDVENSFIQFFLVLFEKINKNQVEENVSHQCIGTSREENFWLSSFFLPQPYMQDEIFVEQICSKLYCRLVIHTRKIMACSEEKIDFVLQTL